MARYHVYRNLHRNDWSLRGRNGSVEQHLDEICLSDCKFVVWQATRLRVIAEQHKLVHAFVRGEQCDMPSSHIGWFRITYNPYLYDSFVLCCDKTPIFNARKVLLDSQGRVYALNPTTSPNPIVLGNHVDSVARNGLHVGAGVL